MNRSQHVKSMNDIRGITEDLFDSGEEYFSAMSEAAKALPDSRFLDTEIEELMGSPEKEYSKECVFIIFAKGNHREILPWMVKFLGTTQKSDLKLSTAAAMAQLGDETGYQFIEDLFQRFMRKDADLAGFDFESFVLVFEEILTNERGQEMIARFRKEANYHVEWHTIEQPDLD